MIGKILGLMKLPARRMACLWAECSRHASQGFLASEPAKGRALALACAAARAALAAAAHRARAGEHVTGVAGHHGIELLAPRGRACTWSMHAQHGSKPPSIAHSPELACMHACCRRQHPPESLGSTHTKHTHTHTASIDPPRFAAGSARPAPQCSCGRLGTGRLGTAAGAACRSWAGADPARSGSSWPWQQL